MKEYCQNAIRILGNTDKSVWAEKFVELKRDFYNKHQQGIICSTVHGLDWFQNIVDCLNGKTWDKKEHKGEYEDNFRRLIELGK